MDFKKNFKIKISSEKKPIKRIVIKIGSALLYKKRNNDISTPHKIIDNIVKNIIALNKNKIRVLLVTSGAVATGQMVCRKYGRPLRKDPHIRRVLASIGQSMLMNLYRKSFANYDVPIAQLLLTARDFRDRPAYLSMGHTLTILDQMQVQPIINENDTIGTKEMQFGDNDTMAAACAAIYKSQLLMLLTTVNGFMDSSEKRLSRIQKIDSEIKSAARGPQDYGIGGMLTKLKAANLCSLIGSDTVILPGHQKDSIRLFLEGADIGTLFSLQRDNGVQQPYPERKKWLLFSPTRGAILIDKGAKTALLYRGSSILFPGIKSMTGIFHRQEIIEIHDENKQLLGKGIVDLSAKEISGLADIKKQSGNVMSKVIIHRNNLVIFRT